MSQIMKAFTGIFIVMFMMVSATGILGAFFQTIYAQNLHTQIIHELENSDYTESVLVDAFSAADDNGFQLEITLIQENDGIIICNNSGSVPEKLENVSMAEVALTYPLQIAFFGVSEPQKLTGYAR